MCVETRFATIRERKAPRGERVREGVRLVPRERHRRRGRGPQPRRRRRRGPVRRVRGGELGGERVSGAEKRLARRQRERGPPRGVRVPGGKVPPRQGLDRERALGQLGVRAYGAGRRDRARDARATRRVRAGRVRPRQDENRRRSARDANARDVCVSFVSVLRLPRHRSRRFPGRDRDLDVKRVKRLFFARDLREHRRRGAPRRRRRRRRSRTRRAPTRARTRGRGRAARGR